MKKKKTNKSLKDLFAYGGTAMKIDSPSEDLSQFKKIAEDALFGSKYDPTVMGLKALGSTLVNTGMSMASKSLSESGDLSGIGGFLQDNWKDISKIVGGVSAASMSFAAGGKVPINAEGGEVVEAPMGMPFELEGPSHGEGGIDLNVPGGTDIYSDRLKGSDGKTMAERKKEREKQIAKIKKALKADPSNKVLKETLKKIQSNNDMLDEKDLSQMQFVKDLAGGVQSFASGGTAGVPDPYFLNLMNLLNYATTGSISGEPVPEFGGQGNPSDIEEVVIQSTPKALKQTPAGIIEKPMDINLPEPRMYSENAFQVPSDGTTTTTGKSGFSINDLIGGISMGDAVGMAGTLVSAFGPLRNTLKNRAGDTPNVNAFKDYGLKGIKKIQDSAQFLDDVRDNKLQELELSRQGTINRNNNSARGINTLRALNLVADSMHNKSKSDVWNQFASAMQEIMGKEAALLTDRDSKVMQGEYARDLADRQDRDNFFKQLGQDISTMGTGLQMSGKNMNDIKTRNVSTKLLNQLYNNFGVDSMTGDVKARVTESISQNPTFYSKHVGTLNTDVMDNISSGNYVIKNDKVYDKQNNEIDPRTGKVIGSSDTEDKDKYKLNIDANSIIDTLYSTPNNQNQV